MRKLFLLPLIALTIVACTNPTDVAPQAEQFKEVPLYDNFVAHVVVETDTKVSSIYSMEIPSTTEFWVADTDGEWVPDMEYINDILLERVELPTTYESESVNGRYAFLLATPKDQSGSPSIQTFFITKSSFDMAVEKCWVQGSTPMATEVHGNSYCYLGNDYCFGVVQEQHFFINCLWQ